MTAEISKNVATPPEDIRQTIDKTIGYVVKNGISFEQRLLANNSDHKFDFLLDNHEFYGYYKWKLGQLIGDTNSEDVTDDTEKSIEKPRDLKFLTKLPAISTMDLEIVKLVALFTAVNGQEYLKRLLDHERKLGNVAQFEFTKKTHSLHPLFVSYIDQYKLVKDYFQDKESEEVKKLHQRLISEDVLELAYNRAQYNKEHKLKVRNKRKQQEQVQVHYASIDWQDFVMVGKIEFDAIDEVQELPVPLNRDDLIYRSLESKQKEVVPKKAKERQISGGLPTTNERGQKMTDLPTKNHEKVSPKDHEKAKDHKKDGPNGDNQDISESSKTTSVKPPKGMKIRAAGESRLKKSKPTNDETKIKCPITGEMIPELKFDNHLKTLLRDPRYKQEQDNFIRKNFSYASNLTTDQVYENIKRLVRKRGGDELEGDRKRQISDGGEAK